MRNIIAFAQALSWRTSMGWWMGGLNSFSLLFSFACSTFFALSLLYEFNWGDLSRAKFKEVFWYQHLFAQKGIITKLFQILFLTRYHLPSGGGGGGGGADSTIHDYERILASTTLSFSSSHVAISASLEHSGAAEMKLLLGVSVVVETASHGKYSTGNTYTMALATLKSAKLFYLAAV